MKPDTQIRLIHRYARANGFVAGFPNFEQADYGHGVVYGAYLFGNGAPFTYRDVSRDRDLGGANLADVQATWRAVHRYARLPQNGGFLTGYPDFEAADHGNGVVYGVWLVSVSPNIVYGEELRSNLDGNPDFRDPGACIRGINRWAVRGGNQAGFPDFEQAAKNNGVVYGAFLYTGNPNYLTWRDVPESALRVPVPVLAGMAVSTAEQSLGALGFPYRVTGGGNTVVGSAPPAGTLLIPFDDLVTVQTAPTTSNPVLVQLTRQSGTTAPWLGVVINGAVPANSRIAGVTMVVNSPCVVTNATVEHRGRIAILQPGQQTDVFDGQSPVGDWSTVLTGFQLNDYCPFLWVGWTQ